MKNKNTAVEGQTKRTAKKAVKISKKIIAIVLVVVIAAGAGTYYYLNRGEETVAELITARVTRGDISSVIEGTGVIEAINQYEVTSLAKGDILYDYFQEGDYVTKGQLLYQMDSSSVNSSIEKAKSSLEKAQMNYDQAVEDVSNLNVVADITGVITELNVKAGDQVSNNSTVAKIVDNQNMLLNVPFNEGDARQLYVGQNVTVTLENSFSQVPGTVARVATGSTINEYGVAVTNVEISVSNPGSVVPGDKATVVAGEYACNDAGVFEYRNESTVVAKVSGKAVSVNYKVGDVVTQGAVIAALESDSVSTSVRSNQLSLNDAKQSLSDSQESLEDYRITAPISGKVIEKNAKAGEKLDQNSSATMAIIADLSSLVFEMSIDELDINKIAVGQKVDITADAMEDKKFEGTVTNISIVGTSTQGVTSYPVKVTIADGEASGLIPGMNVTGNIVVESVTNVLRVPVSAVRRGNFVVVKDDNNVESAGKNEGAVLGDDSGKMIPRGEMPEGEVPGGDGTGAPQGDMPQGERPSMPEGEMPQSPQSEQSADNRISSADNILMTTAHAADATPDGASEEDKAAARLENMKKQLDVPDGYTIVQVETGLSDDTFIEIKSGLTEGQTVLLPDSTESTATTQQGMMGGMPGGMPGGMGGGMPGRMSGGMPGGGGGMPGGGMPK